MKAHENPFRSERIDALPYVPLRDSLDEIEKRFLALGCRAAIVGPHGSGKTTLLAALQKRLGGKNIRFVDGAGRFGPLFYFRLLARPGPFLITAHRRLPFVSTLTECSASPELARCLADRLSPGIDPVRLDRLFERHRGNMHAIFRNLYQDLSA